MGAGGLTQEGRLTTLQRFKGGTLMPTSAATDPRIPLQGASLRVLSAGGFRPGRLRPRGYACH